MNAIPYHLLALAVAVCWGLSVNSTKVLIDAGFGPWAVLALRTVLAYGLLIFLSPKIFYTNLRTEVKTALLGVALVPLAHGLQNLALASGQSSTTAVLTATAPIFTGLLALAFFREFRFHWMSLAGTLAALAGAACLDGSSERKVADETNICTLKDALRQKDIKGQFHCLMRLSCIVKTIY